MLTTGCILEAGKFFSGTKVSCLMSFAAVIAGCLAGFFIYWLAKQHVKRTILWLLTLAGTMIILLITLAGPVEHTLQIRSFLTFSSNLEAAFSGLANSTQLTMLFLPIGFALTYLIATKRYYVPQILFTVPALACIIEFLLTGNLLRLHFRAVLIISEFGTLLGAALCLWGWKIFAHYLKRAEQLNCR
jgi:hypothetical protein